MNVFVPELWNERKKSNVFALQLWNELNKRLYSFLNYQWFDIAPYYTLTKLIFQFNFDPGLHLATFKYRARETVPSSFFPEYFFPEVGGAIFFEGALSLECYLFLYVR